MKKIVEHNPKAIFPLSPLISSGIEDLAQLDFLIKLGADVNEKPFGKGSLLHLAIQKNRPDIFLRLLKAGANREMKDEEGKTPLVMAIVGKRPEFVRILIHMAANVQSKCSDKLPLTWAISVGQWEIVESLIGAGADPFASDSEGTPYEKVFKKNPELKFLKILTKTTHHPAFASCESIHDFFSVLFPPLSHSEIKAALPSTLLHSSRLENAEQKAKISRRLLAEAKRNPAALL